MNFKPKTDAELALLGLWAEGNYPFEVIDAREQTSQGGNDMIALELRVFNGDTSKIFSDYLLEKMAFKLRHFCDVTGLTSNYNAGTLSSHDCIGKSGYVRMAIEKGKLKKDSNSEYYPDKNVVRDYVVPKQATPASRPQPSDEQLANKTGNIDEDVPF